MSNNGDMGKFEYLQQLPGRLNIDPWEAEPIINQAENLLRVTAKEERSYLEAILGTMGAVIEEGRMEELVSVISGGFPEYLSKAKQK